METEPDVEPTPEITPEPTPVPASNTAKTWIIASATTAVVFLAAMFGVKALDKNDASATAKVNAASQGVATFGNRPTAGEVTAIDGTTLTVAARDFNNTTTPTKVTTSKDTTYRKIDEGSLSDLKVGDNVLVTGETSNGVLAATRISEAELMRLSRGTGDAGTSSNAPRVFNGGPPPNAQSADGSAPNVSRANFNAGEITAIDPSAGTLTIKTPDGTETKVTTTSDTKVTVNKTAKFSDIKVGDNVRVTGDTKDNTVAADSITLGDDLGGPMFQGGPPQRIDLGDATTGSNS